MDREGIRTAVHHLADVRRALEEIKEHADDAGDIISDPTWAIASDALTALNEALYTLGVPGDVIHDRPEELHAF